MTHDALKALEAVRDYLQLHPTTWVTGNGFAVPIRSATTSVEVTREVVARLRLEIDAHPDDVGSLSRWAAENSCDAGVALLERVLCDETAPFKGCACGQASFACRGCGSCQHPGSPPCECRRERTTELNSIASNVVAPGDR